MFIVALKEQTDKDLEIDVHAYRWQFDNILSAYNVLASVSGGVYTPTAYKPSQAASAIGGAATGASMGALAASVIPGVGPIFGAIVGGIGGLLGGF